MTKQLILVGPMVVMALACIIVYFVFPPCKLCNFSLLTGVYFSGVIFGKILK